MTAGQLEARWLSDVVMAAHVLHAGDIARVEDTPHTFVNTATEPATFLVVRLILTGQDQREVMRNDKQLDAIESRSSCTSAPRGLMPGASCLGPPSSRPVDA